MSMECFGPHRTGMAVLDHFDGNVCIFLKFMAQLSPSEEEFFPIGYVFHKGGKPCPKGLECENMEMSPINQVLFEMLIS